MTIRIRYWEKRTLYSFYSIAIAFFHIILATDGFSHYNGLNRWSFASKNPGQHELYSDLLCPNPLVSWVDDQNIPHSRPMDTNTISQDVLTSSTRNANDVWTFKSPKELVTLPCELGKSFTNQTVVNLQRILFINVTYEPFDFSGAKECTRFIKLKYDELDGVELSCENDNKEAENLTSREKSYIHWPEYIPRRSKFFSIYQNLENLLRHEEHLQTRFFFQIYFYIVNGSTEICKVQQYELDFLRPEGCTQSFEEREGGRPQLNRRLLPCGQYSCNNLIFNSINPVKIVKKPKEVKEDNNKFHVLSYDPTYPYKSNGTYRGNLRLDVRSIIFLTLLPILLLGALVFGMQIFIYLTCSRRSRTTTDTNRDTRSQQILQNSLNLWETLPASREPRSVSFSPVTTNIDVQLVNANQHDVPVPELPETPKILKSALKRKSNEFFPPPPPDSDSILYD